MTNPYLYRHLEYDAEGSFAPVALVGEVANVLLVHPDFPAVTLEAFVEHCRRLGSNSVSYASPGAGATGHLFMEYFQSQAGIRLRHLPYDSRSRRSRDLLTGQVLIAMDNLPAYLAHIRSGALRALGVTSVRRCECAPYLASIAEQGYPDYEAALWWYIAAPAGTPLPLVTRLSDELVKGIASEVAMRKIRACGAVARPANIDGLRRHIAGEKAKWQPVIRSAQLGPA